MLVNQISVVEQHKDPYRVVKEKLPGSQATLTNLYFRHGGNIYVISHAENGKTRHILVDAGDPRHENRMISILRENGIEPAEIERIILTHRHVDHSGLADLLAGVSQARIMAHAGFRSFVEGETDTHEQIWFGGFQVAKLKKHQLEYMVPAEELGKVDICGVEFPFLIQPLTIDKGKLYFLGCPESAISHSPDQVIIMYSARTDPFKEVFQNGLRPTDDIVFAGDLWLMQGPFHHLRFDDIPRLWRFWARSRKMRGRRRNHREQDAAAKEALKRYFTLVRVKPGHADEFIGSRIIPNAILADRDILLELCSPPGTGRETLDDPAVALKVKAIYERAYTAFVQEIRYWLEIGYSGKEVSDLLHRIYREQSGGNKLVKKDRKERRVRLQDNLTRMIDDTCLDDGLHRLARITLDKIRK